MDYFPIVCSYEALAADRVSLDGGLVIPVPTVPRRTLVSNKSMVAQKSKVHGIMRWFRSDKFCNLLYIHIHGTLKAWSEIARRSYFAHKDTCADNQKGLFFIVAACCDRFQNLAFKDSHQKIVPAESRNTESIRRSHLPGPETKNLRSTEGREHNDGRNRNIIS